jgi:hypothetical protein
MSTHAEMYDWYREIASALAVTAPSFRCGETTRLPGWSS